ncbi:MAG TPA: hypothetical protein VH392_06740 [Sphingomicrobium sp.]
MRSLPPLFLLAACSPALTACVPMMAASAASMAVQAAQPRPVANEGLRPQARELCTAEAAKYGEVHIIDVEQHRMDKIIVWGTVDDGKQKRSFECDFGTKITAFKLREIHAQQ